jgi:hypothetical protein
VTRWSTNPNFPNNGNGGVNFTATVSAGTVTLNQNITVTGLRRTQEFPRAGCSDRAR